MRERDIDSPAVVERRGDWKKVTIQVLMERERCLIKMDNPAVNGYGKDCWEGLAVQPISKREEQ